MHLGELNAEVGRARLAVSTPQRHLIGANIRRLVYAAQSNMGQLPLGEIQTERIAGLLAQIWEESYLYVQSGLGEMDWLYSQIQQVHAKLQQILRQKEEEFPWVFWHEYLGTRLVFPDFLQTLAVINDGLAEFEPPFRKGEIKGEKIDREQALKQARVFSGKTELDFKVTNEGGGSMPTYTLEAQAGEEHVIVEVSQRGGMVLWMTTSQPVAEAKLDLAELVQFAARFLRERGFPPLHLTDAQLLQNRATLTFVPIRHEILRYGESLKVQVSAADGSVLGFWGVPYYLAQSRTEQPLEIVPEQTWEVEDKIKPGVQVLDQKQALIPHKQQGQILTTRLGVQYQKEYYLIYLNAATGEEEDLVQVASPDFF